METFSPLRPSVRCGTRLSAALESCGVNDVTTVAAAAFLRKSLRSMRGPPGRISTKRGTANRILQDETAGVTVVRKISSAGRLEVRGSLGCGLNDCREVLLPKSGGNGLVKNCERGLGSLEFHIASAGLLYRVGEVLRHQPQNKVWRKVTGGGTRR